MQYAKSIYNPTKCFDEVTTKICKVTGLRKDYSVGNYNRSFQKFILAC